MIDVVIESLKWYQDIEDQQYFYFDVFESINMQMWFLSDIGDDNILLKVGRFDKMSQGKKLISEKYYVCISVESDISSVSVNTRATFRPFNTKEEAVDFSNQYLDLL
jgi:hypothetical protein